MPVSSLFCEGAKNSPDIRVLQKVLAGLCELRPYGGKYGMGEAIRARREVVQRPSPEVYGILDGDFRENFIPVQNRPTKWETGQDTGGIHLGWRWEAKEIENYLISPAVVSRALENQIPASYSGILEQAADRIGAYQAARTALSLARPRFNQLSNQFGRPRGRSKHTFPDLLDSRSCRMMAIETHREWDRERTGTVSKVADLYDALVSECNTGGLRRNQFQYYFAGKDLLWAMQEDLTKSGFVSSSVFLEKILISISATAEDVWEWHPEWTALREVITQEIP